MVTRGVLAGWLFVAVVGCKSGRGHEPQEREAAAATVKRGSQSTKARPSFRADVVPVLEANCAGAHGCHGEQPTDKVPLDLRTDRAYEDLVGRTAKRRSGALLVKAGDPNASFLVDKLLGHLVEGEGERMPIDERSGDPITMTPPAPQFVENTLRPWIAAGAPLD